MVSNQNTDMADKYRVVTNAIITHRGKILLGKKEEKEGHPISGEWHFPGGHIEKGEEPEEAVIRQAKEQTLADVKVHQIVDVTANTWRNKDETTVQIIYHVEAEERVAKEQDGLEEVKWVKPEKVKDYLGPESCKIVKKRKEVEKFIERIEKAPY